MKTLKLFNAVIEKESDAKKPFVSEDGYVIEPGALHAKDRIIAYYKKEALNGNELNKTFHKSWKVIKESDRAELLSHQILHYLTTYGTDFRSEAYIPDEVVNIPNVKIVFKVVKSYNVKQMTEKCLSLLKSGVALKEDTIDDVLSILVDELGYKFTGDEGIRNKEAVVKIADLYGILPTDFMGFFRYILFRATNDTLVIKNKKTIEAIKASSYNPSAQFQQFGLEKLAENFNRFKPLFLAFKTKCPKVINRISKLSKYHHKPMVQNALNLVTQRKLKKKDNHWLDNATPYALFKALTAVNNRLKGQDTFLYKIRNGKSFAKVATASVPVAEHNYKYLVKYLKGRLSLKGKKIFIPEDVVFAIPTSEKMFVGNIPTGSKFYGDRLAVGIYWENKWGARDLDLSGNSVDGKVGWNRMYNRNDGEMLFSGDITDAPNGAVEYLYAKRTITAGPTLVNVNIYSNSYGYYDGDGDGDDAKAVGYRIIVGRGDKITKDFMMNPNNLLLSEKVETVQTQMITGLFLQEKNKQSFVLMNVGAGNNRVARENPGTELARTALVQEWSNPLSFNDIVVLLGAKIVKDVKKADVNLSLNSLERDTFTKLFA